MLPFRASLLALYLIASWMLASLTLTVAAPSPCLISILATAIFVALMRKFPWNDGREFSHHEQRVVCGYALAAALFALLVHRPDGDDGGYLNQAVYFANHFWEPFPSHWTIFPNLDAPAPYPLFRFSAFNYLVGLFSVWFEPLDVVAFFIVPVASMLCVFAYGLLFKTCFPRSWITGLGCWLLFLAIDASSPALPSQFSFVRIWQGKSLLLNFGVPFLSYLLVRNTTSSTKDFFLVGSALMGFSPMALLLTTATLCAPMNVRKLVIGAPSLILPIGLTAINALNQFQSVDQSFTSPRLAETALWFFGSHQSLLFWGAAFLASLCFGGQKRLVLGSLTIVGILFNPLTADYVARYLTSSLVFWRVLWICPFAVALGSLVDLSHRKYLSTGLIVGLLIFLPTKYSWQNSSHAELRLPDRKVSTSVQAVVRTIHDRVSDKATVWTPQEVSAVILSSKREIYPLAPRLWYIFRVFEQGLQRHQEYQDREYALFTLDGTSFMDGERVTRIIQDYNIQAVVIDEKTKNAKALHELLGAQGFQSVQIDRDKLHGPYTIWFEK